MEMLMNQQHTNNLMRPTSSRVGNFLSSDKPASEGENLNLRLQNNGAAAHYPNKQLPQAYLPSNLPMIDSKDSAGVGRDQIAKVNTNGIMVKPPLSQRVNPSQKRA